MRPLLRWPSAAGWSIFFGRGALLVLLWIAVYGGADLLAARHEYRVRVHFDFELGMPFWPQFAAAYLSLLPMLWLSPFVLHQQERLRRFAADLAWLIAISGIGFVLLPATPAYPAPAVSAGSPAIFQVADRLNLDFNMLPSLHVGMAVLCAATYSRQAGKVATAGFWIWAFAISASTLVTHQHHVADVVAGAAVAGSIAYWSGRRQAANG